MAVRSSTGNPTGNSTGAATRLGCGRDIDEVWATIDAAPNAHELTCPYCQAARASLGELATATKELTAADRTNPLLTVPAQALTQIMTIARTEVRRGRTVALQPAPAGPDGVPLGEPDLNVSEQAITAVIRRTADQLNGLEARRCTTHPLDPPPAGATTAGVGPLIQPTMIAVTLTVSVTRTARIPDLIGQLRRRVTEAVERQVGITVSTIDVHVEDIHDA